MPMWGSVPAAVGLDGTPTGVSMFNCTVCCDASGCDVPNIPGDDGALLQNWFNGDCHASPNGVDVMGLEGGTYQLWLYGTSSCGPLYVTWSIGVTTWGPTQGTTAYGFVGGGGAPFPGSWVGYDLPVRVLAIEDGGAIHLTVSSSGYGGLAGFQLRKLDGLTTFCTGDLGLCPCGVGEPGRGCPSSFDGSGAVLGASGTPSQVAIAIVSLWTSSQTYFSISTIGPASFAARRRSWWYSAQRSPRPKEARSTHPV